MTEQFLTPKQAGQMIGITGQTVRKLVRAGRMEAVLVSAGERPTFRIRRSEVEKWLAEQTMGRR